MRMNPYFGWSHEDFVRFFTPRRIDTGVGDASPAHVSAGYGYLMRLDVAEDATAADVVNDLIALGFTNIALFTSKPTDPKWDRPELDFAWFNAPSWMTNYVGTAPINRQDFWAQATAGRTYTEAPPESRTQLLAVVNYPVLDAPSVDPNTPPPTTDPNAPPYTPPTPPPFTPPNTTPPNSAPSDTPSALPPETGLLGVPLVIGIGIGTLLLFGKK